ncbi:hypothetical protein RsoM2USA_209 [Ralstonia phage RsoM2USA]|nr:hypothetical protein RsoM2USA_209 [Ralstonia phage RsoM2USA]
MTLNKDEMPIRKITQNPASIIKDVVKVIQQQCQIPLDLRTAYIAGGFLSRVLEGDIWDHNGGHGLKLKGDVDLFFTDSADAIAAINNLKDVLKFPLLNHTSNSSTFSVGNFKLNVVKVMYKPRPTELLDTFDFHLCQMATDGKSVLYSTKAIKNFAAQHLTFNEFCQTTDDGVTLARLGKYGKRGYVITHHSAHKMVEHYRKKPHIDMMQERKTGEYYNS